MQNFEPNAAVISVSSNSALIMYYLINTCLGQGAVPSGHSGSKSCGSLGGCSSHSHSSCWGGVGRVRYQVHKRDEVDFYSLNLFSFIFKINHGAVCFVVDVGPRSIDALFSIASCNNLFGGIAVRVKEKKEAEPNKLMFKRVMVVRDSDYTNNIMVFNRL